MNQYIDENMMIHAICPYCSTENLIDYSDGYESTIEICIHYVDLRNNIAHFTS